MNRVFCVLTFCLGVGGSTTAEEQWIDDTKIRDRFLEQTVALHESGNEAALTAEELRRALRRETTGLPSLNLPDPSPWNGSPTELYARTKRSTLIIGHLYLCDSCDEWHANLAGGVILTPDGVAATNYHVLQFEKAVIFAAMDHRGRLFAIEEVLASSRKDDLAIIRLKSTEPFEPAPIANGAEIGDPVVVISHPDAHFFTYTTGSISRYSKDPKSGARRVEITAPFARGSSGSGIFSRQGHLVGLASATNAIYYEENSRDRRNLQMVIHSGVPTASLKSLIGIE